MYWAGYCHRMARIHRHWSLSPAPDYSSCTPAPHHHSLSPLLYLSTHLTPVMVRSRLYMWIQHGPSLYSGLLAEYTYLMILTLCLPSHHQLPVHLWTLETRRLSRIPIRHEPAKGQRHSQNPSAMSTILPRKATHLTQRLSPLLSHQILVNKLTVLNTNLCVRQFP